MSNFALGLFPGWLSFVMLLPFIMMIFGLWFICRAFTDRGGARQEAEPEDQSRRVVVSLPDRSQQPLYRVHQQIQASARPPPKAQQPDEPARASGGRPRRRRHHGTTTRLELRR